MKIRLRSALTPSRPLLTCGGTVRGEVSGVRKWRARLVVFDGNLRQYLDVAVEKVRRGAVADSLRQV